MTRLLNGLILISLIDFEAKFLYDTWELVLHFEANLYCHTLLKYVVHVGKLFVHLFSEYQIGQEVGVEERNLKQK